MFVFDERVHRRIETLVLTILNFMKEKDFDREVSFVFMYCIHDTVLCIF